MRVEPMLAQLEGSLICLSIIGFCSCDSSTGKYKFGDTMGKSEYKEFKQKCDFYLYASFKKSRDVHCQNRQ